MKRDTDFFKEAVLPFIQAKLEKTFIDWYILSRNEEGKNTYFTQKLLAYSENDGDIQQLNIVEKCLLAEVCLEDILHKDHATGFSKYMIQQNALS